MALTFGTQITTGAYLVTKENTKVLSVMKSKYPCNSIESVEDISNSLCEKGQGMDE